MFGLNRLMRLYYKYYEQVGRAVKAVITQNFTEVNVKTGNQHEASLVATIPAASSSYIMFKTTDKPVIIKGFDIQARSGDTERMVYRGSVSRTLGSTINPYNPNDINPVASTVQLNVVTAVDLTGSPIVFAPRTKFTAAGSNQTPAPPAAPVPGIENILRPNTEYFLEITNLDIDNPADVEFYLTWYEGVIEEFRE